MSTCQACDCGLGLNSRYDTPRPHVYFGPTGPEGRPYDMVKWVYVCMECFEEGRYTRDDFEALSEELERKYQNSRRTCAGKNSEGKPCKRQMSSWSKSKYCSYHQKEASQ